MRAIIISFFIAILIAACQPQKDAAMLSQTQSDYSYSVDSLLALMTLEEKIGQLNQYSVGEEMTGPGAKNGETKRRYEMLLQGKVGSVLNLLGAENTYKLQKQVVENSRLGIPLLFAYDVVHGYHTMFPIPLAEAASWSPELARQTAAISAKEAAVSGLHWTFAPMVDISYDARWGRVMEGAGEDPFLGGRFAAARVQGFQGNDLADPYTVAACAKHFAGYGFVQSGKDYNNVNIDKSTMLNDILPPFKDAIAAGAATIMTAFNDFESIPSSGNQFLLREVLKGSWNFGGVVVSDWNSIGEMMAHRVATDSKEAARKALAAGTDVDMEADAYSKHLTTLVDEGLIDIALIDDAVRRVLHLKYALGLFDNPYKYSNQEEEKKWIGHETHISLAREAAQKSIVLLKNDNNILPLNEGEKLAVIGPLAKDKDSPLGNWRARAEANSAVSVYEGLEAALNHSNQLQYAEGCKLSIGPNNFFEKIEIETSDRSGFVAAIAAAKRSDKVIMVLGETAYMSGEARSRAAIGLPGLQMELLKAIYAVNKNIILVLMNGRPLTLTWEAENIPAIVEAWHLGSVAGHAIADVLSGKVNPSGKLPMSFPRHVGQLPLQYNHKSSGRPVTESGQVFYTHHADVDNSPLFPFGYGLSYTTFDISAPHLPSAQLKRDDELNVRVMVKNTGKVKGTETVQLYIRDHTASVTRPEKELKAFQQIELEAGESKEIDFVIDIHQLGFYTNDLNYVIEPGLFSVMVGSNSQNLKSVEFELKE